jgi:hypothetical protein
MREEHPMKSTLNPHQAKRSGVKALIAGATVASILATGAVAQAGPGPYSGRGGTPAKAAVIASVGTEGAAEHGRTRGGSGRVEATPATSDDGLSTTVVIALAGIGGLALAIPAAHVYRRRNPSRVANA